VIDFSVRLQRANFILDAAFSGDEPLIALFGASGSGKSTILHLIAGLLRGGDGRIALDGRVYFDSAARVFVPRHQRHIGLVFQDAQLFPHMTVSQNLRFGRAFAPKDEAVLPPDAVIEALGLRHLLGRRTPSLSGGEKQRVALARALLAGPKLLLMDEPLSSLDDTRKDEILPLIEQVRDRFGVPIIYVTHSKDEVLRLASKVVLIENGRVAADGDPSRVFALKA
jgi:molybdate transport system ATP-binding protein